VISSTPREAPSSTSVASSGERAYSSTSLDLVLVHGDRAGGDPRRPRDHPLPAVLDRDHLVLLNRQVRLVVQTAEALDDRLLDLVQALGGLAGLGVDLQDRVVVQLHLEIARPAAVAAQPGGAVPIELAHHLLCSGSGVPPCAYSAAATSSS
jgi:hypothetical protein